MIDGADLELFEQSLRHATETATGAALDTALDALGWRDALAEDPRAAVSTLFHLQGAANATSSALSGVLANGLGLDNGELVVLPALGHTEPPGRIEGGRVVVRGLGLGTADRGVVVASGAKNVAGTIALGELSQRAIGGIDPTLGLVEITGATAVADVAEADWTVALTRAQLAVGHELVGAARKMLELACNHARERIQFDRPIASFQAVRHRLADTLLAIETADAALSGAWADQSPHTAAMAKALAGRGARTAARHCQQVLAGIGFTTEHPFHRYVRRVLVLDQILGSARGLTDDLGRELLRTRQLPAPLPLC